MDWCGRIDNHPPHPTPEGPCVGSRGMPSEHWPAHRAEGRASSRAMGWVVALVLVLLAALVVVVVVTSLGQYLAASPAPRGPSGSSRVEVWQPLRPGPAPIYRAPVPVKARPWV